MVIINIKEELEQKHLERLVETCCGYFPKGDRRIITEIVTGYYKQNKNRYNLDELKEKMLEEVGSQLRTYRSAFPTQELADIIPFKRDE